MIHRDDNIRNNISFLKEKVRELHVAKRQTWEEKERLSHRYEEERRINLANKVNCLKVTIDSVVFFSQSSCSRCNIGILDNLNPVQYVQ